MRTIEIFEWILIFLAMASLWPGYILDWPSPIWDWFMYAMLGVMVLVFLRRAKRLRIALEERQKEGGKKE
jgi:hypothetical protein